MKKFLFGTLLALCAAGCSSDDEDTWVGESGGSDEVYATDATVYEIPVVFHVFYTQQRDSIEYVREGHLPKVLEAVNRRFANCGVDLKLSFKLATTDPSGQAMAEPGVNRIKVRTIPSNRESTAFLKNADAAQYMWDQTRYLNICLFREKNEAVLGISSFPYTLHPDTLAGMPKLMEMRPVEELNYPHCVYINSQYIYDLEPEAYKTSEIVGSICHEISHYLGLRHAFGEDPVTYSRDCDLDTDFCEDTPTYNKYNYDKHLLRNYPAGGVFTPELVAELAKRTNSLTGETFVSTNIMDYAVSYLNTLTPQQCERIRYILMRSPYVPGPKVKRENAAPASMRRIGEKQPFPHRIAF